jgi:SagB-type dehydrogenase family enzyme
VTLRPARVVRFRRSPHLITFWRGRDRVVHNIATGAKVVAGPIVCSLLDGLDTWQSIATVTAGRSRQEAIPLAAMVRELARQSFLERSDRARTTPSRALDDWADWNPAASFFHLSTKDVPYETDVAAAEKRQRRHARRHPMPPSVKSYPRLPHIALPAPERHGELPRLLLERRTWRHFSSAPIDLSTLATLLELTWGVQRWALVRRQGRVAFKTSPSGGARHPIEAYVLAVRVKGLPRGLYHYAADRHGLDRLTRRATRRQIVEYCADQAWYGSAAAIVIMTAVFSREQWRYRSPRAYRAVLLDAGHLCQTFCLLATWLNLAPFCTMALADSRIERDLKIDGVSESVVYVAGVGSRPKAGWSQRLQRAALRL